MSDLSDDIQGLEPPKKKPRTVSTKKIEADKEKLLKEWQAEFQETQDKARLLIAFDYNIRPENKLIYSKFAQTVTPAQALAYFQHDSEFLGKNDHYTPQGELQSLLIKMITNERLTMIDPYALRLNWTENLVFPACIYNHPEDGPMTVKEATPLDPSQVVDYNTKVKSAECLILSQHFISFFHC